MKKTNFRPVLHKTHLPPFRIWGQRPEERQLECFLYAPSGMVLERSVTHWISKASPPHHASVTNCASQEGITRSAVPSASRPRTPRPLLGKVNVGSNINKLTSNKATGATKPQSSSSPPNLGPLIKCCSIYGKEETAQWPRPAHEPPCLNSFLGQKQQPWRTVSKGFILLRGTSKAPNEERSVTGKCWNDK